MLPSRLFTDTGSNMQKAPIPVLGFAAYSGTGKTTLLKRLIPLLREQGLCLGLVKHAHHDFDLDIPGKDSYELRKAGAAQVLVASHRRWALVTERGVVEEPELQPMLERMDRERLDLILVEGFKHERFPKIELYRPSLGRPLIHPQDPSVIAVATDGVLQEPTELPLLDLNDPAAITDFILAWMRGAGSQLQR
jgi:molybdopterin-guanine dinucleotide biosynthesis protein B